MAAQTFLRLPGLALRPEFVTAAEATQLWQQALAVLAQVQRQSGTRKTAVSPLHNLQHEKKEFEAVTIEREDGSPIQGEYFAQYGTRGTSLAYFRGRHNLPRFIASFIDTRIAPLPETQAVARQVGKAVPDLTWRWTFNHYAVVPQREPVLFPFHKDIAVNGRISCILTLGSPALFEMATDEKEPRLVEAVTLKPRSLVVLADESRWNFVHRVVAAPQTGERISFVFGCQ